MRLSIMQPSYIPWLGYFDLIKRSDVFMFYDDVQYTKNDWRNRNQIRTSNGTCWLTIPIGSHKQKINETWLSKGEWVERHLATLKMNYSRAPYFKAIYPLVENWLYVYSPWSLDGLCRRGIDWMTAFMGVPFKPLLSSDIGHVDLHKTDRLIAICKHLGADEYLSPNGAASYIEAQKFEENGIKLIWQDYKHPVYNQLWGEFIPCLSILDLLFNHGGFSWEKI
jgi:hypothetical protein